MKANRQPWQEPGMACQMCRDYELRMRYSSNCQDCFYGGMGQPPPKDKAKVTVMMTLSEKEVWEAHRTVIKRVKYHLGALLAEPAKKWAPGDWPSTLNDADREELGAAYQVIFESLSDEDWRDWGKPK